MIHFYSDFASKWKTESLQYHEKFCYSAYMAMYFYLFCFFCYMINRNFGIKNIYMFLLMPIDTLTSQ